MKVTFYEIVQIVYFDNDEKPYILTRHFTKKKKALKAYNKISKNTTKELHKIKIKDGDISKKILSKSQQKNHIFTKESTNDLLIPFDVDFFQNQISIPLVILANEPMNTLDDDVFKIFEVCLINSYDCFEYDENCTFFENLECCFEGDSLPHDLYCFKYLTPTKNLQKDFIEWLSDHPLLTSLIYVRDLYQKHLV